MCINTAETASGKARRMLRLCIFFALLSFTCTGIQANPQGPEKDPVGGERQVSEGEMKDQKMPDKEEMLRKGLKLSDLPPKQAEKGLQQLVDHIDTDGNSGLSVGEMVDWMVRLETAQRTRGLRDNFREADRNNNGFITLAEFAHTLSTAGEHIESNMDEILAYSRPFFNVADENNDGQLTLKEYAAFMHPELHLHMTDVLVETFLEQFDNNDDGYVSFYEYMAVYMPTSAEARGNQPDWADSTRTEFRDTLDHNRDGLLDKVEMRGWVTSDVTQKAHDEAKKILHHADKDNNGEVSHNEALGEFDLIAASKLAHHHHVEL